MLEVQGVVAGAALALSALLVLAAIHKLLTLRRREARIDPMVAALGLRPFGNVVLATACTIEVATALLLIVTPVFGLATSALLLIAYTCALLKLPHDADCRCFGGILQSRGRRAALIRNLGLLTLSAGAWALAVGSENDVGVSVSQSALGVAIVLLAAGAAFEAVSRVSARWSARGEGIYTGSASASQ